MEKNDIMIYNKFLHINYQYISIFNISTIYNIFKTKS